MALSILLAGLRAEVLLCPGALFQLHSLILGDAAPGMPRLHETTRCAHWPLGASISVLILVVCWLRCQLPSSKLRLPAGRFFTSCCNIATTSPAPPDVLGDRSGHEAIRETTEPNEVERVSGFQGLGSERKNLEAAKHLPKRCQELSRKKTQERGDPEPY